MGGWMDGSMDREGNYTGACAGGFVHRTRSSEIFINITADINSVNRIPNSHL